MIQKAKLLELPEILNLTRACGRYLITQGIFQWNEHYPSESVLKGDVERGELYVLRKREKLIGIIALTTIMDPEYASVSWMSPSGSNLYVHRLAIAPEHQGKGYASELMSFAETLAREDGYTSIRLDTFSQNKRNQAFYEKRGYTRLEDIYLPLQSEHPFYCYELLL